MPKFYTWRRELDVALGLRNPRSDPPDGNDENPHAVPGCQIADISKGEIL